jgi:outer membrane protein assembly factor BamB
MLRRTAVAALAAGLLVGCSGQSAVHQHPGPEGPPAPRSYSIAGPVGLAGAGSSVWVVSASAGTVTGFDARSGRKLRTVAVGDTPLRATFDGQLLWVSVFGAGKVVAVEPKTGTIAHRVAVPGQPEGIVSAFGAVWVVRQQARQLTRISPTGQLGTSYSLGAEPRLVTASSTDLFVADVTDGTITRIDPKTGRRTVSKQVCDGAQDMADAHGTLWVTCTRSDRVVAVDEQSLQVTHQLTVKNEPDGIRGADGHVFIVTTGGPTVYELPADGTGQVERRAVLGKGGELFDQANDDLAVAGGVIWVSDYQGNRLVISTVAAAG